jgi:type IV secretion system protein VirD4
VSGTRDRHGGELALLALLAMPATAGGLVWAWTGLAGALFGTGWPSQNARQLAAALTRLPLHLNDPRQAWLAPIRDGLPTTPGFYAALAALAAIMLAAAMLGRRAWQSGLASDARDSERHGASWARRADLRALHTPSPKRPPITPGRRRRQRGRLALGYHGRRLLCAEERHALVVFGPTQSYKSAGLAIPALLEWDGPAIASSTKTDLLAATISHRRQLGEVMVFDPFGLSPTTTSTWTPLHAACDWDGALSQAMRMTAGAELDTSAVRDGSFWRAAAEARLAPLLYAAARTHAGIGAVVRWAYGQGDSDLPPILQDLLAKAKDDRERADAQAAFDAHAAFAALASDTRSSVESNLQVILRAYRSPRVQASAHGAEITPERLLSERATLYLIGDSHRSRLLRPIFLTLLAELIDSAYHKATLHGGQLPQPLLLCLDELGNVAPLPNLGEIASTAASHNIQLVSIFHDVAQARARYGDQTLTAINNHRARMLLPGVADLDTLRYFSDLLGHQHPRTKDHPGDIKPPRERRPLAAPEQLRQLRAGHALLIYGRLAPTRIRLRAYYQDRRLKKLANPPPGR